MRCGRRLQVRNVTHTLGVGPADRLRTNATYAVQVGCRVAGAQGRCTTAAPATCIKDHPAPACSLPPMRLPACLCTAQGLPEGGEGASEVERRMSRLGYRVQLGARLGAIRAYVSLATALDRALSAATYMLGYPVLVV